MYTLLGVLFIVSSVWSNTKISSYIINNRTCPQGYIYNINSPHSHNQCIKCPINTIPDYNQTTCAPCPNGYDTKNYSGSSSCYKCAFKTCRNCQNDNVYVNHSVCIPNNASRYNLDRDKLEMCTHQCNKILWLKIDTKSHQNMLSLIVHNIHSVQYLMSEHLTNMHTLYYYPYNMGRNGASYIYESLSDSTILYIQTIIFIVLFVMVIIIIVVYWILYNRRQKKMFENLERKLEQTANNQQGNNPGLSKKPEQKLEQNANNQQANNSG